ncbi:MAG: S41 family peptidase [Planctomycetota bacterium]|nr:S41 family peptidase [Planctomycetota bacterium]
MPKRTLGFALLFAALPLAFLATNRGSVGATPLAPVAAPLNSVLLGDLTDLVQAELAEALDADTALLWERARALRAAAKDTQAGPELDEALEQALDGPLAPRQLLFAAAARLSGEGPDHEALRVALDPMLDGTDQVLVAAAAELLGDPGFRTLGADERAALATRLQDLAENSSAEPAVRIAAATSSFTVGRGLHKGKARSAMRSFLASSDPELRGLGALALAEIGDEVRGELEDELQALANVPGPTGRLAESYLKLEATRSLHEAKYSKLQKLYNEEQVPDNLRRVTAVLEMIQDGHLEGNRLSEDELIDAALDGMLGALDEHSSYMAPESYKQFSMDLLEENYGGIGAYVRNDPVDDIFTITRPIYSGPAYEAGLATDDKIVQIDDWPTLGNSQEDVIKRLKGKPGTSVRLYIWRRGMDPGLIQRPTKDMLVEIERAQISVPSTAYQMLPGKIGLIELRSFTRTATKDVREALDELMANGMQAVILDLRFNSGGLLSEARGVSDLFLPPDLPVVKTEARIGPSQTLKTLGDAAIPDDMPVVVLVNRYSASASEIVSGALQDHKRARIVGERSFGKGSVQNLFQLYGYSDDQYVDENRNNKWDSWEPLVQDHDGDGEFDFAPHVRLTIARYLLPSGRSIHREFDEEHNLIHPGGVEPDLAADAGLIEGWRLIERRKLNTDRITRDYVDKYWDTHHDEFAAFAVCDNKDTTLYPSFDEFFAGLDTPLDKDDVRVMVRAEIRRRMQDERGGAYPFGDFVEDTQVQVALKSLLEDLGQSVGDHEEYATTFEHEKEEPEATEEPVAKLDQPGALEQATAALIAARDAGGDLDLDQLIQLLESAASPR